MHAAQMTTTEIISAAMPSKVSVAARSSASPVGFGLRWHRDILAANASLSGRSLMPAKTTAGKTEPNEGSPIPKADAKTGKNAHREITDWIAGTARGPSVAFGIVPSAVAVGDGRSTEPKIAAGSTVSSKSKHEAKAPGPANVIEAVNSQTADSSTAAIAATQGVEVNVPVPALAVNLPQSPAVEDSGTANTMSPATKLDRTSKAAETGKDAPAKSGLAAVEGLALASAKQVTGSAAVQSKAQHGSGTNIAEPDPSATEASAKTEMEPSIPGVSHSNQTGNPSLVPQTLAINHAALSSVRDAIQLQTADGPDTTGVRSLHVVPSGPAQLDVGVWDGTHGWLRIRAELGTGGALSASLTANTVAHESLRAVLPEMAKYLGSEAIGVTSLAVHRFASTSNTMASAMETSQQNGDTRGHDPRGEGTKNDGEAQKHNPGASEYANQSAPADTSQILDSDKFTAANSSEGIRGFSHEVTQQAWPFGALDGINGSWLNVCA